MDRTNSIGIEPEIDLVDPSKYDVTLREMRMAGSIGDLLAKVYPGYYWLVNVDFQGGIATIECGQINTEVSSNMPYSYVLHLSNMTDPSVIRKKVIYAGGELLERANRPRGKWDGYMPTHFDGAQEHEQPFSGRKIYTVDDYQRQSAINNRIEV